MRICFREKKRAESLNSGNARDPVRRARSNVGETTIVEDELVASFTNIETDSNADSGVDDGDEVQANIFHYIFFVWKNALICTLTHSSSFMKSAKN